MHRTKLKSLSNGYCTPSSSTRTDDFSYFQPHLIVFRSSILDLGFWNLLWGIISSPDPQPTNRPINVWLANLLNRVSAAPLLLTLLKTSVAHASVCRIASSCFDVIWPLTVHKIPTEATLECFGALLGALRGREADEGIARLGMLTVSTYRTSFHRSSNRKKVQLLQRIHFDYSNIIPILDSCTLCPAVHGSLDREYHAPAHRTLESCTLSSWN